MPKIVMVNTVGTGSHGRIMRDLQSAAQSGGFDARLAYGRWAQPDPASIRIGSQSDVLRHVALTRLFDRHAQGSRAATRRFILQLEAEAPDIIHLHNLHGYYLHAQTFCDFIRAHGVPLLWTLHDCWALTGHCSHFVRAHCQRWQTGCHSCPLKREYPASLFVDASKANYHWKKEAFATLPTLQIASPSLWLDQVLSHSFLRDVPRHVLPNGVDLSLFTPGPASDVRSDYGIAPDIPLLLAVAAPFDARKGFADAIAVAEALSGQAHVMLVGLSQKQCAALPANVTGIQRTDGPEALVRLYQAADCLINPTHEDTYPTVNMEAMACGLPVAGYGVGGAAEQLAAPGAKAIPVGKVRQLAEAAMALSREKAALSAQCRAWAQAHFDRAKTLQSYVHLYHQMTGV